MTKNCIQCGKEFRVRPSSALRAKFCSYDCSWSERRTAPWIDEAVKLYTVEKLGLKLIQNAVGKNRITVKAALERRGVYEGRTKERAKLAHERNVVSGRWAKFLANRRYVKQEANIGLLQLKAFEQEQRQFKRGDESKHWAKHPEVGRWKSRTYARVHAAEKRQYSSDRYYALRDNPLTREKWRQVRRSWAGKLADGYVRTLLAAGTDLKPQEFPPELVELKREQLRLIREASI